MRYFPSTRAAIGSDAVDRSGDPLVDPVVVAVIRPGDRGLDGRTAEDSRGPAGQKGFIMGTDCNQ